MIRDIANEIGVTSVVITHDMASTFRIGDRISMLHEGKIVVTGTPEEMLQSPARAARVRRDLGAGELRSRGRPREKELGVAHGGRAAGGRDLQDQLSARSLDQRTH